MQGSHAPRVCGQALHVHQSKHSILLSKDAATHGRIASRRCETYQTSDVHLFPQPAQHVSRVCCVMLPLRVCSSVLVSDGWPGIAACVYGAHGKAVIAVS